MYKLDNVDRQNKQNNLTNLILIGGPLQNYSAFSSEKTWLNRTLSFSRVAAVASPDSEESTRLLQDWSREMGHTVRGHFVFAPFRSPQEILGFPNKTPLEEILKELEDHWEPGSLIIWEHVHNLSTQVQILVLNFLRSSKKNSIHVFSVERPLAHSDFPCLEVAAKEARASARSLVDPQILSVDGLDSLSETDLSAIEEELQKFGTQKASAKITMLLSRCLFLRGQRVQAFENLKACLMREASNKFFSQPEGQELLVETIRLANRNGRFDETEILAKMLPVGVNLSAALKDVFDLEKILAEEHRKSEANTSSLDRLIERFSASENRRFVAEALFQRARIHDSRDEVERALFDYRRASTLFQDLGLPYQTSTALLNCAWLLVDQMKWEELLRIRHSILQLCERFGYPYILASLDTIEAQRLRLHGQLFEAIQLIQKAIEKLEVSEAPSLMLTDSVLERARILLALGQRTRALESIETYLRRLNPADKRSLARVRQLQREMQVINQGAHQWLEEELARNTPVTAAILSAERGSLDPHSEEAAVLERFPVGKLALLQNECLRALGAEGLKSPNTRTKIQDFYRASETLPQLSGDRTLAHILRAQLEEEPREKEKWLQRSQDLVLTSGSEQKILEGLQLWVEAEQKNSLSDLWEDLRWQRLAEIDRERWASWIRKLRPSDVESDSVVEYFTIAEGKLKSPLSSSELERYKADALYIDDRRNLILYRGKNLRSLGKKGVLYDLLKVLIQASQNGHSKEELSALIWGEDYRPTVHDPRIYVAVRRIREIFRDARMIQQHRGKYLINPQRSAVLIREQRGRSQLLSNNEKNVLLTLRSRIRTKGAGSETLVGRSELQKILGIPEATLKRSLQSLLRKQEIKALGSGRNRKYCL